MKLFSVLIIISLFSITSCNAQSEMKSISGKWSHVYEEDHDDIMVYKKGNDLKLPPARFRQVYIFEDNNKCKLGNLAANDAHSMSKGTYTLNNDLLKIKKEDKELIAKYQIIKFSDDKMELKKLE